MDEAVRTDYNGFNFNENHLLVTSHREEIEQKDTLSSEPNLKVDVTDPRTNQHFVKFIKHRGITVRLWECGICGREFQHQYMLRRHLPGHTGERNYHCQVCGKSFRQLSTLSQHRTIHSLARPHTCMVCGKNFNRISTLISHRKTHLDEKPFKCHICYKGFHQKGNLRNHLFSHTNERPYRCNLCDKGFNQQSNLTCHMKKVHPSSDKSAVKGNSPTELYPQPKPPSPNDAPTMEMPFLMNTTDNGGILVDPIDTPEMEKILQKNQVPFALLKHNGNRPVFVKIFTTNVPKGKHMLVPVTAQDLINGGKFIFGIEVGQNQDGTNNTKELIQDMDATSSQLHLEVPIAAILESSISVTGQHNITVHPPATNTDDHIIEVDCIKVDEDKFSEENSKYFQNTNAEYVLGEIDDNPSKGNLPKLRFNKGHTLNRAESVSQPMATIPSKDPVLNYVQQTAGEGSGLMRVGTGGGAGVQFGSPQHLLDPQGSPSYATDYDCRNLELFEPLDCIDTGKIKHEWTSIPSGDATW